MKSQRLRRLLDGGRVVAAGAPDAVLTPPLLKAVYGVEALIDWEPSTEALRVTYLRPIVLDRQLSEYGSHSLVEERS